jgi:adenylylsulfate kinase
MKKSPNNVTWFNGSVSRKDREHLHGHRGFLIWLTGLSASGKSTIAHLVEKELHKMGCSTYVLDGDNVRHGLCADLRFSHKDRTENIRRIGEMVKLFVDAGTIVLTAFISPFKEDRERIRSLFSDGDFIEVYTCCSIDVCASRDTKGIYKKAKAGKIKDFTGISSPYEEPENPEIVVHTDELSTLEASSKILTYLRESQVLDGNIIQIRETPQLERLPVNTLRHNQNQGTL